MSEVTVKEVDELFERLGKDAEASGYHLNPNAEITMDLVRGLVVNIKRYGYQACPCRLASGDEHEDLDIICPCDYRDPDLGEHGMCYCALYVSGAILSGEKHVSSIPERRPAKEERAQAKEHTGDVAHSGLSSDESQSRASPGDKPLSKPVWRCRVCGYLCGRDEPPEKCPICGATKERFERFM